MLPIPTSMNKNDCSPGKGIILRCSNPVIDLSPTFYTSGRGGGVGNGGGVGGGG